ncbi:MAG: glucosyltransferase domain-containing protein [Lachnospiraceae bacterium]|nr:glucosyltransferase domain-containing protein [Lachnospiraceae bacterium]
MTDLKKKLLKPNIMIPFLTTIVVGLLVHFPVMAGNLPNADAMSNFYFDQNMVTSGRWFLTIACGFSSYYDLKWLIGLLSIFFLAVSAVLLTELFETEDKVAMGLTGALLVSFPAVSATFAYMYTADGYFMAFALSVLAVLLSKRYKKVGWLFGAVALAFSMGTYQAYLAATILLCLFDLILMCMENRKPKDTLLQCVRYLGMGVLGGILYYVILKICLFAQGKELDTYQGINNMGKVSLSSLPGMILGAYRDFAGFLRSGKIFLLNGFSYAALILLFGTALISAVILMTRTKAIRKWYQLLIIVICVIMIPVGCNIILLISAEAFYHLLMRMQWGLFPIMAVIITERMLRTGEPDLRKPMKNVIGVAATAGALLLCWQFFLSDQIAYFNMNERYEKTYAYCVRLADRIEQTPGYYTGMPVMMIGVLDEEKFPVTDITGDVTERIYGSTGDMLIYKGEQYQAFMQHYLNVSINVLTDEKKIVEIYNSDAYREMESFPAADSVKIVDGILYVKTEPPER